LLVLVLMSKLRGYKHHSRLLVIVLMSKLRGYKHHSRLTLFVIVIMPIFVGINTIPG